MNRALLSGNITLSGNDGRHQLQHPQRIWILGLSGVDLEFDPPRATGCQRRDRIDKAGSSLLTRRRALNHSQEKTPRNYRVDGLRRCAQLLGVRAPSLVFEDPQPIERFRQYRSIYNGPRWQA